MKRIIVLLGIGFVSIAALTLAAQDVTSTPSDLLAERAVTVLPLEEVTESAPEILDLTSTSARLHVVTSVPLACSVVFGTSEAFGNLATDPNMAGATMTEHNPLLLDLQPETQYFYRLQGFDVNGTLYISEIGTFTTPSESTETTANLLSPENGAEVIGVSSNYGGQPNDGSWGILNAFDGNLSTAWSSNGDGDDAWFEVQLGQPSHISQIVFQTRIMADESSRIFDFSVTNENDEVYGPFELPDADQAYTFDTDFEAATLRFDVGNSSGGNTGAVEIEVYGEPLN